MPLWPHQAEAVNEALKEVGYMIPHDMGVGKSYTAIEITNKIEANKVLILCPKTVVEVWEPQFLKHSERKFSILSQWKKNESVKSKAKKTEKFLKDCEALNQPAVIVLNYDACWRPPLGIDYEYGGSSKKQIVKDVGVLLKTDWDLIICDESHRIKAPGSKVSWYITKLGKKAKKRLCLSGTPLPHSPLDAYAQYRFLNSDIFGTNFHRFKMHYAIIGGYENKQVLGFKNQDELHEKFFSISHKMIKASDVLELPDKMHEKRLCELSPKAMKIYNEFKKKMVVNVKAGELTATTALVKLLRLSQIAGGYMPIDDSDTGEIIDNSKIDVLKDILEDLPPEEPVVVFSRFTNEIQRIKTCAEKLGRTPAELSGHMNDLKRWQDGYGTVLAVQIRAGGVGVDLTRARICIYYSLGYSLGDAQQSAARVHRPGQTRKVLYFHILAKGTTDETIYKALKQKKKIVDYVLNDIIN